MNSVCMMRFDSGKGRRTLAMTALQPERGFLFLTDC